MTGGHKYLVNEEKPPLDQNNYVRLTLRQLWDHSPQLLAAGFIFSGLSLPALALFILNLWLPALLAGVLVVAPAWAALLWQEAQIAREVKANLSGIFKAWPRYWLPSVKLGLLAAFPLGVGWLTLPALAQPEVPAVVWVGLAADLFGLLLMMALYIYTFPLMVIYDLDGRTALRNAFILSGRYLIHTAGLLSLAILFILGLIFFSLGLLFILPAIWGMFIVNNCRLVVHLERQNL